MAHKVLGNYELLEKVGAGAMGAVFKARQISMDRIVALKILPPKLAADPGFVARFVREAKSAGQCSHENLIPVHEVAEVQGYYFYSMEFVGGPTLKRVLAEKGPLPEDVAVDYMTKIAGALGEAHRRGIVHRDVKPDNIILTKKGEPKLADLGLAKPLKGEGDLTFGGRALGTPHYMSPEQVRGGQVDGRADLYALGGTFFHLLTGRTLFEGPTAEAVMTKHVSDPPPDFHTLRPDASSGLEAVLAKLLAKSPDQRYPDATSLIKDLKAVGAGRRPRHASVSAGRERGSRRSRQRDAGGPARRAGESPQAHGRSAGKTTLVVALSGIVLVALLAVAFVLTRRGERHELGQPRPSGGADVAGERPTPDPEAAGGAASRVVPAGPSDEEAVKENKARQMFEFAVQYLTSNPDDIPAATSYFEKAREAGRGTVVELQADAEVRKLKKRLSKTAEAALSKLKREAQAHQAKGDYDGALAALRRFPRELRSAEVGDHAERLEEAMAAVRGSAKARIRSLFLDAEGRLAVGDVDAARRSLAELIAIRFAEAPPPLDQLTTLRSRLREAGEQRQAAAAKRAHTRLASLLTEFEEGFRAGRYGEVAARMKALADDDGYAQVRDVVAAAGRMASLMEGKHRAVRRTLEARVGKQLHLKTAHGIRRGRLEKVTDEGIELYFEVIINRRNAGHRRIKVRWEELPPEEQDRLAEGWSLKGADGQVIRTYLALWGGDVDAAQKAIAEAGEHPFAPRLRDKVKRLRLGEAEMAAREAWAAFEKKHAGKKLTPEVGKQVLDALAGFEKGHGKTRYAEQIASKIATLRERAERIQIRNYVTNGSFESGALDGWGANNGEGKIEVAPDAGAADGKSVAVVVAGSKTNLSQELNLEPGEAHRFSLRAKLVTRAGDRHTSLRLRIIENVKDVLGESAIRISEAPLSVWSEYAFHFVPGQAKVRLEMSEYYVKDPFKILLDGIEVVKLPQPEGIPADAIRFGKNVYKLYEIPVPWHGAKAFCERRGGHLATITSKGENDFIVSLVSKANHDFWLGLTVPPREGAKWRWLTNEPFQVEYWGRGYPRSTRYETIYGFVTKSGAWANGSSRRGDGSAMPYVICEWESKK